MSHTYWEIAKRAPPTDPSDGRYLSRPHAHRLLGIYTKEIAGCIMTDFRTDLLQGESQLECEDYSGETSEADSPSSCESNSDCSPIKPGTDDGYLDELDTSSLRFPLESWQEFATSRGSTSQPPASGNDRARISSTSTASNKRGRDLQRAKNAEMMTKRTDLAERNAVMTKVWTFLVLRPLKESLHVHTTKDQEERPRQRHACILAFPACRD
ncbi:hypothetical protein BKA80DRAFT_26015 [Phyllosticta citrichinensis]